MIAMAIGRLRAVEAVSERKNDINAVAEANMSKTLEIGENSSIGGDKDHFLRGPEMTNNPKARRRWRPDC